MNLRCMSVQGPDVTLATNAFSTMSFNTNMEAASILNQKDEMQFLDNITKPARYLM